MNVHANKLSWRELVQVVRAACQPRGSAPVVNMGDLGTFFLSHEFVEAAIDQMAVLPVLKACAEPSALEKLGIELLLAKAGVRRS